MRTASYIMACLIALVLVAACQSAAAPEVIEREVEVTREVQVAGETQVEERMVEVTRVVEVAGETRVETVMEIATPTPVPTPSAVEEGPSGRADRFGGRPGEHEHG